jgi:NDP-sugar pyrophosphorylase family protein
MKAMVLAAGLGTRLRPLTDSRPKALVEVAGRTMLEITLSRLRSFGIEDVIINAHHFADLLVDFLKAHRNFGMRLEVSREDVLLDTGGGLKKAAWYFLEDGGGEEEPFLMHNVDVISTIDLAQMVRWHRERQAIATLAVQDRQTSRYLLFDPALELCGRELVKENRTEWVRTVPNPQKLAFAGIQVLSPRFLRLLEEDGVFSIIGSYLRLAGKGERVQGYRADEYYWMDLGKPENVKKAEAERERWL